MDIVDAQVKRVVEMNVNYVTGEIVCTPQYSTGEQELMANRRKPRITSLHEEG